MSKVKRSVKRAVKSVAKFVNKVVPNEVKPAVKVGLALIPGAGPALSAAYTAVDSYGGGASLGDSVKAGAITYGTAQIAGAASKALGVSNTGNDLTDALGMTANDGILGLGSATTAGTTALGEGAVQGTKVLGAGTTAADKAFVSSAQQSAGIAGQAASAVGASAPVTAADTALMSKAASAIGGKASTGASSLLTFDNIKTAATIGSSLATAGSTLAAKPLAGVQPAPITPANQGVTQESLEKDAAEAVALDTRRKRKGATSNIYTSPLGLLDNSRSAASALLG